MSIYIKKRFVSFHIISMINTSKICIYYDQLLKAYFERVLLCDAEVVIMLNYGNHTRCQKFTTKAI